MFSKASVCDGIGGKEMGSVWCWMTGCHPTGLSILTVAGMTRAVTGGSVRPGATQTEGVDDVPMYFGRLRRYLNHL